jgi:cell division protease FtsH
MTVRVEDPKLLQELEAHQVKYTGQYDNGVAKTLLSWLLPLGLLVLLWSVFIRRLGPGQGVMNFGKSRARIYAERETGVTFTDVAGVDEAKEELQEIIDFLRYPQKYASRKACYWSARLVRGRPCWRGRWQVRRRCRFLA